ncbi:MAG TPA: extracellular solute-binding protein [Lacisediminihabitans sp.]|uniref:ABC transporter substrate-binding protein n=1 Tax=Lacisediminihabitans sp. TaxID=2787631 RepID=UPI002EDADA36
MSLSFWSWAPKTQQLVDTWNKAHPNVQVKYTDAGGGNDSAPKLRTASRAGNAPDLAAVEYTTLPSLIVAGVPLDITSYVKDIKSKFTSGTWAQTTFDGQVYGVPQDVGPMAVPYRTDRLAELGIAVPKTWEDFGKAAEAVHAADPDATLASLPADQFGFYAGVATQAGSKWWSVKDGKWTVGIADEDSLKVADFFEKLAKEGAIKTDPILTPEWNKDVNEGNVLSWPSALWAPGVIEGIAPDTIGKWTLAALPQWTAGDESVAYQGGSAVIITKGSKHPKEAAEFAKWLNASEQGAKLILNTVNAYPAAISGQKAAEASNPPALMPQQKDYYTLAAKISSETIPVTWGPDVNVAQTTFTDALNKAIAAGTPWRDAFKATQTAVVKDLKSSGFKVTNK